MKTPAFSIESYVAMNNPKALARVLEEDLGAPKVTSNQDLLNKIHYATEKFGIRAFEKLAEIDTPYRKLILSQVTTEKKSNCGGHSNCSGCSMHADGAPEVSRDQSKSDGKPPAMNTNNTLMTVGITSGVLLLAVIAVAAITK